MQSAITPRNSGRLVGILIHQTIQSELHLPDSNFNFVCWYLDTSKKKGLTHRVPQNVLKCRQISKQAAKKEQKNKTRLHTKSSKNSTNKTFRAQKNLGLLHPGRLTWNIQITHLERKMIFQTPMIMFHVDLPECNDSNCCRSFVLPIVWPPACPAMGPARALAQSA